MEILLSVGTWFESQGNLSVILSFRVFSTNAFLAINLIYFFTKIESTSLSVADIRL